MKTRGKTIKRSWTTKSGELKTKEYVYRTDVGLVFINKGGRVNTAAVQKYLNEIRNNTSYDEKTKTRLEGKFKYKLNRYERSKRKFTERGFEAMQEENKMKKYFMNLGYDSKELAEELGVSEDELLNEKNWKSDVFTVKNNGKNKSWKFAWRYKGSAYDEVKVKV